MQKIAESEELGAQTAAELHRQREALERTKERLNESEATLRESESEFYYKLLYSLYNIDQFDL